VKNAQKVFTLLAVISSADLDVLTVCTLQSSAVRASLADSLAASLLCPFSSEAMVSMGSS
jgi:hypothetical protein